MRDVTRTLRGGCAAVALAVAPSCSLFSSDVACDPIAPCPANESCVEGFCRPLVVTPLDAGGDPPADAGTEDAGTEDAGTEDAGSEDVDAGSEDVDAGGEDVDAGNAANPICDETAVVGDYCNGDKVSGGEPGVLYRCNGPGPATVQEVCEQNCVIADPGFDDFCI